MCVCFSVVCVCVGFCVTQFSGCVCMSYNLAVMHVCVCVCVCVSVFVCMSACMHRRVCVLQSFSFVCVSQCCMCLCGFLCVSV